jgi:hypothetical protein
MMRGNKRRRRYKTGSQTARISERKRVRQLDVGSLENCYIHLEREYPLVSAAPVSFRLYDLSIGERCRHERSDDLASGVGGGEAKGSLSRVTPLYVVASSSRKREINCWSRQSVRLCVCSDGVAKDREEFRVIASGGLIALQNHRTNILHNTDSTTHFCFHFICCL